MITQAESFFKYFPCSPAYREWGFCVVSAGYGKVPANHPYPPVIHPSHHHFNWEHGRVLDSYTFVYISRGGGLFESEATPRLQVSEGQVLIVFPNTWHRYKPNQETGWDEHWIEFTGNSAENFIGNSQLTPKEPLLTIRNNAKIMHLFLDTISISQHQPHGFEFLLSAQAFSLLTQLMTEKDTQNDDDYEKAQIVRQARLILLSDLDQTIDLKLLAAQLGISYSLFRKTFKTMTGFSPYQYRLDFRLHRASQLLKSRDLQVGQIAEKLGFSSIYHFSELFKKKNGLTPMEFRKQHCALHYGKMNQATQLRKH
ncbi:MAG: helix-turn-helix domain-containing protein [Phycisphaerae bacterium]|jgi:AraC-like DNA-binding protein